MGVLTHSRFVNHPDRSTELFVTLFDYRGVLRHGHNVINIAENTVVILLTDNGPQVAVRAPGRLLMRGQHFRFKHLSAQWRRPLGLLLHVPGQLLQLLLLLGAELVRLGAEELFLKLGNLGSRLRQQLLLPGQEVLRLGQEPVLLGEQLLPLRQRLISGTELLLEFKSIFRHAARVARRLADQLLATPHAASASRKLRRNG